MSQTSDHPLPTGAAEASAPGKIILCGEHAVVYGRPAIALPLADLRAQAAIFDNRAGSGITIDAPQVGERWSVAAAPENPLSELVVSALARLAIDTMPDLTIRLTSSIPIASGMGSGAAIATALVRALSAQLGRTLPAETVSELVYASERRFHGTPSGIDNTVIAHEQPIWFQRLNVETIEPSNDQMARISIARPFTLLIGDTGTRSPTRLPVGEVRKRWQADPRHYEALFDAIAAQALRARAALAQGDLHALGASLDENQALLVKLGVSSAELDRLVAAARAAGASGAKLSGAGWGGVMIALVDEQAAGATSAALLEAGAARVLQTTVERTPPPYRV
jgi:mevalonate kinase